MQHLASLGPIAFIDVPFRLIEERIARNPERVHCHEPRRKAEDILTSDWPCTRTTPLCAAPLREKPHPVRTLDTRPLAPQFFAE